MSRNLKSNRGGAEAARAHSLKVLLVEDDAADAELILRELKRAGLNPDGRQVQTETDFRRAIDEFRPQIILSDFSMPRFDGMQALALARELCPDTPFLFVSGTLGEEYAIRALKDGATDYVLKTNLLRLPPAVERALQATHERAARREMEGALVLSEAGLRRAQLMARLSHVITGADGSFERWSEGLPALIGMESVQMPKTIHAWLGLLHPDDRERLRSTSIEAARRGTRMDIEYRLHRPDDAWLHVRQVMEPIDRSADAAGRVRWFNTLQDITAQKQAEAALKASEERYRVAFEQTAVGVVHTSLDGDILVVNPKFCAMSGYVRAEAVQLGIHDLTHPADIASSIEGRSKMLSGAGVPDERELRLVRKDRRPVWVHITTSLVTGDDGKPLHFISVLHDISERKRAEQAVQRFRTAIDNSGDLIVIVDRASMLHVDVNETACKLLGYTREELLRMGPADILPAPKEELERMYDELISSPSNQQGMRSYYRCKDGSHLPFESSRRALYIGDAWVIVAIGRDIRERIAAEQALRESAALRGAILASSLDALVTIDHKGSIVEFNPAAETIFGFARGHALGKPIVETIIPPQYREAHRRGLAHYLASGEGPLFGKRIELTALRADGTEFPVELAVTPIQAGSRSLFTAFVRDITARREAEAKITRLNRVYAVLSGINAAIVRIQDRQGLFEEVCRIAHQAGQFPLAWIGMVDADRKRVSPLAWSEDAGNFIKALPNRLSLEEGSRSPAALAVKGKEPFVSNDVKSDPRLVLKEPIRALGVGSLALLPLLVDGEAVGVLGLHAREAGFFDDDEMKLLQELAGDVAFALDHIAKVEKLDYLALHDPLTGLANRRLVAERLGQSIREAGQAGAKFAIAWFDLERFATVNESLGRQAGDALIRQVAERLARSAGPANVGRVTGDEFVVILPQVKGRSEAGRVAGNLARTSFGEPFRVNGPDLTVTAKAGLALFPNDGTDAETLLGNAEAALRKSKETGERQTFYSADLTERTGATLTLESKLRRALERDEFVLHYQPKIDIETRRIAGMEALIRWQSPELGLVAPAQFVPLMERTGMILEVGAWALRRASIDHRRWTESGREPPRMAVNVSAIQLRQRDFVQAVEQAIVEGLAPTRIDLEITESLIMENIEANIEKLTKTRQLGVEIAIDDFGTGYSSLSYLAKLPVQTLKIDRSFIISMLKDPDTMSLVQTIISLAHSLRLKVVAEGVETEEQAKILRLLRCDQMQGYLFSKPLASAEVEALLKSTSASNAP